MEMQEWKDSILDIAKEQISYKANMSNSEINSLTLVLSAYLNFGINILKKWRKLKTEEEFVSGIHDEALVNYIKAKYQMNGRDIFNDYSSADVKSNAKTTPENELKASCKQVM